MLQEKGQRGRNRYKWANKTKKPGMARLGDGERDKTRKPKALNESERERWEGELIRAWAFYLPEIKRVCCVCLDMLTLLSKLKVQQEQEAEKQYQSVPGMCMIQARKERKRVTREVKEADRSWSVKTKHKERVQQKINATKTNATKSTTNEHQQFTIPPQV